MEQQSLYGTPRLQTRKPYIPLSIFFSMSRVINLMHGDMKLPRPWEPAKHRQLLTSPHMAFDATQQTCYKPNPFA